MSLVETLGSPVVQLFLDGKYAGSADLARSFLRESATNR
jgi:hypothetical protein